MRGGRWRGAFLGAVIGTAAISATAASPAGAASTHLTRAPYFTDAVGTSIALNWATDVSASTGFAKWGAVDGSGNCTPTNTVTAARTSITVNGVSEYQWSAVLSLPVAGTYCARIFLAATDLLAGDPSVPFSTQIPRGSNAPFSFAVLGDWGQVDSSGNNVDQANLMHQIAASGAAFVVSAGDNAYPSGSQTNDGDLNQKGADISAVFGPSFWPVVGKSIPMFVSSGNHGISSTTAGRSTEQVNWPETVAAATSGGKYVRETYCCVNGTSSASYPSSWYAFDAGVARFYVLQADWADGNVGTGTVYSDDYAAHWAPGDPEYEWLKADLAAHPSGLKFAFFHYPLRSDQKAQNSDTFLQGSASLEGLLSSNHVSIAFNGHAHLYQRNVPTGAATFPSYVTGGGGATLQPIGESGCSATDAYGIGWSPSKAHGSRCGSAPVPDDASRVYHFLLVHVDGSTVTVSPTDELGRTFDVQTYAFSAVPDTVIDSAPPSSTNSATATFAFHSTQPGSTFVCSLDGGASQSCTSPVTYTQLSDGPHSFSIDASAAGNADPSPATDAWTVDTVAPSAPTDLAASAPSPALVNLTWTAATDNNAVAVYRIYRNGTLAATVAGSATSDADTAVSPSTAYTYQVVAVDAAGNASSPSNVATVTTPGVSAPVFADGFEAGNLSAWTSSGGLAVENMVVHGGSFAAEGNTTNGGTYAKKTLPSTYTDAYSRVWFNLESASSQVNLLRYRSSTDASIGYLFVSASGQLGLRNDVAGTTTLSTTFAPPGTGWHELELHTLINGSTSSVEVWLDGTRIDALSITTNLGTAAVGRFQIGEVQTGRTYDVVFDDAAFATQRIGP